MGSKFEALSKLVGWRRQLDAAAASTLPIVNTMLETEVQTISRQLYALLVVKREGKGACNCPTGQQGRRAGGMASIEVGQ